MPSVKTVVRSTSGVGNTGAGRLRQRRRTNMLLAHALMHAQDKMMLSGEFMKLMDIDRDQEI